MNNIDLNKEKIVGFNNEVIEGYLTTNQIIKMVDFKTVLENEEDPSFNQFSLETQPSINYFKKETGSVYYYASGHRLGAHISQKEFLFFKNELEKHKEIIEKKVNMEQLKPQMLIDIIDIPYHPIILSSTIIYKLITQDEWMGYVHLDQGGKTFIGYPWYSVSSKILGDSIYVLDKYDLCWTYTLFNNEFTKRDEKLNIEMNFEDNIVDITIHSSVYFEIIKDKPIYKFIIE